jgi:integral membrane sensor domain MASE1
MAMISLILGFGFVALCSLLPLSTIVLLRRLLVGKHSLRHRADVTSALRSGAGLGAFLLGTIFTMSRIGSWHGHGVFGILWLPPVASIGAAVGVILAGLAISFKKNKEVVRP